MANLNEKQDKFVCVNLLLRKESNKDEFETPK